MKQTTQRNRSEEAVSPVVGVMLMLIVTIIIAAVVSSFAGGLVASTERAPNAVLDVKIYSAANVGGTMSKTYAPDFTIDHLSGEPLNTADLKLIFDWKNKTDTFHTDYTGPGKTNFSSLINAYSYDNSSLYRNGGTSGSAKWGDCILVAGEHVQTGANYLTQDFYTGKTTVYNGSPFMDDLFGLNLTKLGIDPAEQNVKPTKKGVMELLPSGTLVSVQIVHTPSGKLVYDKVVSVQ